MLLLLSLFTFISFDRVSTWKMLQRYSSFVIVIKCTKYGEVVLCCEELLAIEFVEINVDALFDLI